MAIVVAVVAVAIFISGVVAGVVGLVAVAVHKEEREHSMTRDVSDRVTRAGRWLTGLSVRRPTAVAREEKKTLIGQ